MKTSKLLIKLSKQLFAEDNQREKFVGALTKPIAYPQTILWTKTQPQSLPFQSKKLTDWQPDFVDCLPSNFKPGKLPLHQQGYYYCLDFSSVFAASALLTISQPIKLILDMCASPGGKSIFAWRTFSPELLIANEVIGKRIGMLWSNFQRCQIKPAAVVRLDSQVLAELIPQSMSLVLVDAPCSGQSLIAKGLKAPGCFHPVMINKNANRQKRILANSLQLVAPQGYLLYSTCTYAPQENESVVEWLLKKFPNFKPIPISHLFPYQSQLTSIPAYRIFPQSGLGAGAFTCLLQNQQSGKIQPLHPEFLSKAICRTVESI